MRRVENFGQYAHSNLEDPELLQRVIKEYLAGKSMSILRQEIKCDHQTLKRYLIENGVRIRDKQEAMDLLSEQIRQRGNYKNGFYVRIRGEQRSRLVWEYTHQKPLPKKWHVHHLNGITYDDRPENLLAMPDKKHVNFIPILKKRIRELEIEADSLRRTKEAEQVYGSGRIQVN